MTGPRSRPFGTLRDRGIPGVVVCSGSAEVPELAEAADLVVDGPAEVAALLAALADTIQRGIQGG